MTYLSLTNNIKSDWKIHNLNKVYDYSSHDILLWNNPVFDYYTYLKLYDNGIVDYTHQSNVKCTKLYRYHVRLIYDDGG